MNLNTPEFLDKLCAYLFLYPSFICILYYLSYGLTYYNREYLGHIIVFFISLLFFAGFVIVNRVLTRRLLPFTQIKLTEYILLATMVALFIRYF